MSQPPELYVLGVIASDLREMIRLAAEAGLAALADLLRNALEEAEAELKRRST